MPQITEITHGELLEQAAAGDARSWELLVDRFAQMVWSVARGYGLDDASAKDVSQTVWLRLVENLDRIDDPERLPGWLATTCRREAIRVSKRSARVVPSEFEFDMADPRPGVETLMIEAEEQRHVVEAFNRLDAGSQRLLRLLATEPPLSYEEIAEILGRPVGSIGPTRARCIDRLKAEMARMEMSRGNPDRKESNDE